MITKLLNNAYARLYSKNINTLGIVKNINIQSIWIRSFSSNTESNLIKQGKDNIKLNNKANKFILPTNLVQTLPAGNQNLLQIKLQQLDQTNKLLLHLNKQIEGYPHKKISDNLNNYSVSNGGPSVKFIDYSFNKNIKGNLGNISTHSTSRAGIINFVTKIIKSLFNSLSSLVGNIQFINQHNKLILRIKYYQNYSIDNSLYSNKHVNFIYKNILNLTKANKNLINKNIRILNSEPFKATSYNYNYLTSTGLSTPKRILIKYLKDLINLNINKSSNSSINEVSMQSHNFIDFDVIDNKITNDKLIENKISAPTTALLKTQTENSKITNTKNLFNNNLLKNLTRTNTLDYLNNKRLKSLRLIKNKPLLSKLLIKFNKEQLIKGELVNTNAGKFTQPLDIKVLAKLSGGVIGMKGTIGSKEYAPDYYNISNYLIATNFINSKSDLLKNNNQSFILKWKLANKITKSIAALKLKYNNDYNEILNNIYNKIIFNNQSSVFSTLQNNKRVNNLLNTMKVFPINNINTIAHTGEQETGIKQIFNVLKLIFLLNAKFNSVKTINSNIIFNKIKQGFLSNIYYNNKTNNNYNILKNNINKFKALGIFLSKIFAKNVEIQLIRLWSIGLDSAIMAQIISKNSNFNNSRIIIRKLLKKIVINKASKFKTNRQNSIINGNKLVYNIGYNKVNKFGNKTFNLLNNEKANLKLIQINDFVKDPSNLNTNPFANAKPVGISIKINGRLSTERIQPRKTTKRFMIGTTQTGNVKDTYRFTAKNKRGAFSISIKMGNARNYSTSTINSTQKSDNSLIIKNSEKLNPWAITGFTDAEGCFSILIPHYPKNTRKWSARLAFVIGLNKRDIQLLKTFKHYFKVGRIYDSANASTAEYRVCSIKELQVIIDHFDKFPLVSAKISDYLLFREAFSIIKNKEHLTDQGLDALVALSMSSNLGVSDKVKEAFTKVQPATKPLFKFNSIPDPNWISGFVSGDGSLGISLSSNDTFNVKKQVQLRFKICLNIREDQVVKGIANYFNKLIPYFDENNKIKYKHFHYNTKNNTVEFLSLGNTFNTEKIIPFFEQYPLIGAKLLDFADFKTVAIMIQNNEHLTEEGLNKIKQIQDQMNLYETIQKEAD